MAHKIIYMFPLIPNVCASLPGELEENLEVNIPKLYAHATSLPAIKRNVDRYVCEYGAGGSLV